MLKVKGFGLLLLLFGQNLGSSHYLEASNCFTDIDMRIPVRHSLLEEGDPLVGISQEEFMLVLSEIETVYTPVFQALGKSFTVNKLWASEKVNALARQRGDNWDIDIHGGLGRHEYSTLDSLRAVVCHEIGHHLGGAPKMSNRWVSWASSEGQSDYFAASKCMSKLILEGQQGGLKVASPDLSIYEAKELALVNEKCAQSFPQEEGPSSDEQEIRDTAFSSCKRAALAGLSFGRLQGSARSSEQYISLATPDETVVVKTGDEHPKAQCRADTYFAGSLCNLDFNLELSNTDANIGTCNRAEGFNYGVRPLCWFKPS